ncbi:porin [Roseinatronobacter sp. S2]|uniref:porin n=1 Tax=Roseinatronobacter sp. S2 TaxID=3035471 RepID=UPI0024108B2C|nr:porin [Roseinatronobacter sp. S2]WFE75590.1 porin [Roseinatronobacter sp. S2]
MRAAPLITLALAITALATSAPAQHRDGARDWRENPGLQISGDARMGIVWTDRPARSDENISRARFVSRARVRFQFSAETDGGTRFGFGFDAEKPMNRPRGQHVFIGN